MFPLSRLINTFRKGHTAHLRKRRPFRLAVERLEDRRLLAHVAVTSDLWDISQGSTVTDHSAEQLTGSHSSFVENMFGHSSGFPAQTETRFVDFQSVNTEHFVEWQTQSNIALQSFHLFAAHDGGSRDISYRGFNRFTLFASNDETFTDDEKIFEIFPSNPYGDTSDPDNGCVHTNGDKSLLALAVNVTPTPAQYFRAEFVQAGGPSNASGPRIYELDGFDEPTTVCAPSTIEVDLDIKPGSFPNSINVKSMGVVPVAILGSASFDVTTVDVTTLEFGPDGATPAHAQEGHLEDVNEDGFTDLVAHFRQKETGLAKGDTEATLTGATLGGTPISGTDSVNTAPGKALHLAGDPSALHVGQQLTDEMLEQAVQQSIAVWTPQHDLSELTAIDVQIGQLDGTMLGHATDDTIWIDQDAAGYGWSNPGGVDLLTALSHEFGHVLGLDHDHGGVMEATLAPGVSQIAMAPRLALTDVALLPPTITQRDALFTELGQRVNSETFDTGLHRHELLLPTTWPARRLDHTPKSRIESLSGDDLDDKLNSGDAKTVEELLKDVEVDELVKDVEAA